jgi:hypothetical protein
VILETIELNLDGVGEEFRQVPEPGHITGGRELWWYTPEGEGLAIVNGDNLMVAQADWVLEDNLSRLVNCANVLRMVPDQVLERGCLSDLIGWISLQRSKGNHYPWLTEEQ